MPTSSEWEVYHRWCKEYGTFFYFILGYTAPLRLFFVDTDIIHLDVAGTSIVVLNTVEAATELLDNRSAIYSSRFASVSP